MLGISATAFAVDALTRAPRRDTGSIRMKRMASQWLCRALSTSRGAAAWLFHNPNRARGPRRCRVRPYACTAPHAPTAVSIEPASLRMC